MWNSRLGLWCSPWNGAIPCVEVILLWCFMSNYGINKTNKQIYFLQFVIQKFGYAWRTMRTISPEDDLNDLKLAKCYMLLLNPCPSLSFQQSVWFTRVSSPGRPHRVQLFSISSTDLMGWSQWFNGVQFPPIEPSSVEETAPPVVLVLWGL